MARRSQSPKALDPNRPSELRRKKKVVIGHLRKEARKLHVSFRTRDGGNNCTIVHIGHGPDMIILPDGTVKR